jgi:two-component system sensor histidine kinase/response regulator
MDKLQTDTDINKNMNEFSSHEIKIVKTEFAKHVNGELNTEQLKKTEKFFDRILKNNNAIKLLINVETNKIVNSNEAAQRFYGYSQHELHSREIFEINVLKGDEVKAEYIRSKKLGRDYFKSKQKNSLGEIKNVMVRSTPLTMQDDHFIYLIIHELSDDKKNIQNETSVKNAPIFSLSPTEENSFLDDDLSLIELNASKDRFFSIISHDLKNSFFSVMGLSKILADPENEDSAEKKLETAQMLNNSSKKLYAFLENLLSWARVQRGETEFEPAENNLYEIAVEVIYLFNQKAEQNGINLTHNISSNTSVFCDSNMTKTILRNLVSNALFFSNNGGSFVIDSKNNEDEVIITVTDTGVGISELNINKLLRIDSKHIGTNTQGEKGTGLGLILCKEFVEKHSGNIWIESELGKGSRFVFTLPNKKLEN